MSASAVKKARLFTQRLKDTAIELGLELTLNPKP